MSESLISVIVPVYKVEPYLRRCVDSIINQNYENLEIILVDDGSPDNCGTICDEYAEIDPRVLVIHKANGGVSSARNAGLDIASGEFVTYIDADDYVSDDYISSLAQYDADVVVSDSKELHGKLLLVKLRELLLFWFCWTSGKAI